MTHYYWCFSILTIALTQLNSQELPYQNDSKGDIAIDTINKKRVLIASLAGGTAYVSSSIALYKTWYSGFERSSFHFHNDWNEWQNLDKFGHVYSSYFQSLLSYKAARWTGMKDSNAILLGSMAGLLFQSTVEVMDGFSKEWGFSAPDMMSNLVGIGLFSFQQSVWKEQRILVKMSTWPNNYLESPDTELDPSMRASEIFGSGFFEKSLKDYNAQTIWLSINPGSFAQKDIWPDWLNLAVGYGAENMYGGYSNDISGLQPRWEFADRFPRYKQFYLSMDVDLSKIKTKSSFLRTVLDVLNIIKMPFSAIEINTLGEIKFHAIHF